MRYGIKKFFACFIIWGMVCGFLNGCDQGDKVIDQATGNQSLEQFKMTKDKLKAIDEKQKEKHQTIPGDETKENK